MATSTNSNSTTDRTARQIVDQTDIQVDFDDGDGREKSGNARISAWLVSKSAFKQLNISRLNQLPSRWGGVLWLDCGEYDDADLGAIGQRLKLDGQGVEAALAEWSQPGIEAFADHALVSATAVDADVETIKISACELDIFIGKRFVVTAHRSPIAFLERAASRVETDPAQIESDPAYLLYILLDELIDDYYRLADELDGMVQGLEDIALSGASNDFLAELVRSKQFVYTIGRLCNQHSSIFHGVLRPDFPFVSGEGAHESFVGLNRRFTTVSDMLSGCRQEMLSTFDIHMSRTADQTNATVKTLTMISVFVLPATAVFGFFGSNFTHLPFFGTVGFVAMVLTLIALILLQVAVFKRKGWLGR